MAEKYLVKDLSFYNDVEEAKMPENAKKRCVQQKKIQSEKAEALKVRKTANKKIRAAMCMRRQKYEKEYKAAEKNTTHLRREAKRTRNFYHEPEAKLMFVIRITGINKLAPKPRKILQLLRLNQLHKGVFVKITGPMLNMLKYIMPYIVCGYPNKQTVEGLILRRGYGKVNGERHRLQNNQMIEQVLGKECGIYGIDDLIHEIFTVGPHFKKASNFLWPFKLSSPRGGFVKKRHGFHEARSGDWGNREELINQFVRRMW